MDIQAYKDRMMAEYNRPRDTPYGLVGDFRQLAVAEIASRLGPPQYGPIKIKRLDRLPPETRDPGFGYNAGQFTQHFTLSSGETIAIRWSGDIALAWWIGIAAPSQASALLPVLRAE